MVVKSTLENAFEDGDWKGFIEAIESVCKNELGYRLVKSCHCVEKPPDSKIKGLQKKAKKHLIRHRQPYNPKDGEIPYEEHVKCLHYSDIRFPWSKKERGIIFMVEGLKEAPGIVGRSYGKGIEIGLRAKYQKMGSIEMMKGTYQDRQNILHEVRSGMELGIVTCYSYEDGYAGQGSLLDFECKSGKSWRRKLKIPKEAVLKNVNFLEL